MTFWEIVWFIVISFCFVAYLMLLFQIFGDLFRDRGMSGWLKAVWVFFLIVLPFLSAFVYLIARGPSMAERQAEAVVAMRAAQDDYIRSVAGDAAPAQQIGQAKALLDQGAISQSEFDALKSRALSTA